MPRAAACIAGRLRRACQPGGGGARGGAGCAGRARVAAAPQGGARERARAGGGWGWSAVAAAAQGVLFAGEFYGAARAGFAGLSLQRRRQSLCVYGVEVSSRKMT